MLTTTTYNIPKTITKSNDSVEIVGQRSNQVLVIIKKSDLTDQNLKTLTDMMMAVKRNLEECTQLILVDESPISINQIINDDKINTLLSFGNLPKQIGMQFTGSPYQVINTEGLKMIIAHTLGDLNQDKAKKIALWQSLQTIFS